MKRVRIKKIKRICDVNGCGNIDSYVITAGGDFGNSIIICGECLKAGANLVRALEEPAPENPPQPRRKSPAGKKPRAKAEGEATTE